MRTINVRLRILVVCAFASGCTDAQITTPETLRADVSASAPERFSWALADALRSEGHRRTLLAALRDSPYTEHRQSLVEIARGDESAPLLQALASAMGINRSDLLTTYGRLDIYVPNRLDRRSWQGSANYVVAQLKQHRAHSPGVLNTGAVIDVRHGVVHPGLVVIAIEPASERVLRINPQPKVAGQVIEMTGDGTMGGIVTYTDSLGNRRQWQLANNEGGEMVTAFGECYEDCTGGGGGDGSAPADTTLLKRYSFWEGDDCSGYPDPSFVAELYRNGTKIASGSIELVEAPPVLNQINEPLVFERIHDNSNDYINLHVFERDNFWCGGDDDMGWRNFVYTDNGHFRTLFVDGSPTVDVTLSWTPTLK